MNPRSPRAPLPPRVGDVYRRGLDVRRVAQLRHDNAGVVLHVRYARVQAVLRRGQRYGDWMKITTWYRWAGHAQLIESGAS